MVARLELLNIRITLFMMSPKRKKQHRSGFMNTATRFTTIAITTICALAAVSLSVAQDLSWPDPVANHVIPMQSTPVTHGPVLGNVTANSVRVWLRADSEIEFDVLLSERTPFDTATVVKAKTIPENDFTGFAEVSGLKPNTVYAYAIRVDNEIIDGRGDIRDP